MFKKQPNKLKYSDPIGPPLRKRRSSSSPEINAKVDVEGTTDKDNDVSQVVNTIVDDVLTAVSIGLQAKVLDYKAISE